MNRRITAIAIGTLCHVVFALAVIYAIDGLYGSLSWARGTLTGTPQLIANLALLLQFPLLHSFLLSSTGTRLLAAAIPFIGKELVTTSYVLVSSLQLLSVFLLWSPWHTVVWENGMLKIPLVACYGAAWILLVTAMTHAGLGIQLGYLGWSAVARGDSVKYPSFADHGLYKSCRHPIYLSFALILWTGPEWTVDHLVIASTWTAYCVIGPLFKERRYLRWYGEKFARYRARTPYFFPRFR